MLLFALLLWLGQLERLVQCKHALDECSFLNLCDQYGLLSKAAKAAARNEHQEALDQNTRRQQKIERFKREREIKAQLTSAQMKRARIAQLDAEVLIDHSIIAVSVVLFGQSSIATNPYKQCQVWLPCYMQSCLHAFVAT